MSALTLQTARTMLQSWLEAEAACSTGQSYRIGTRELTRADLRDIASRVSYWSAQVDRLEAGGARGARVLRIVPRD